MSGLIGSVGEAVLAELRAVNRTLGDIRDRLPTTAEVEVYRPVTIVTSSGVLELWLDPTSREAHWRAPGFRPDFLGWQRAYVRGDGR